MFYIDLNDDVQHDLSCGAWLFSGIAQSQRQGFAEG